MFLSRRAGSSIDPLKHVLYCIYSLFVLKALIMSTEQGVGANRKGSGIRSYPRAVPKGSVGTLDSVRLSPTVKRRPYRRTLSLDIQLDEVVRMGSKKPQTMAFEELLGAVLQHFGEYSDTHTHSPHD